MSIPGVPAVPSGVTLVTDAVLLFADVISFLAGFGQSPWGIYLGGVMVIEADTVVSMGYKQDWSISTYPVEQGGFQSYNKVDTPFNARVRFASGGSQANRQDLLDSITGIAGTLTLYDVVTPEAVYQSVNIQAFSYNRSAQNVGLIQVDVTLLEVRVTASAQFTNTKASSGEGQQSGGTVQPYNMTDSEVGAIRASGITK
jgi:hypothetical protein